jgi:hypothetical protein
MHALLLAALLAAPAPKAEGLLLGLRTPQGDLQTWFVDGKTAEKLGDGIALPGRDGWTALRLVTGEDGKSHREHLWVGQPGVPPPEPPRAEEGCEEQEKIEITFVSGEQVGSDRTLSTSCEGAAHPGLEHSVGLRKVEAPETGASAPIGEVLGQPALEALKAAWAKGRKELAKDELDCLAEEPDATSWTLARRRGAWGARALIPRTSEACRGLEGTYDFDVEVPAKIGGSAAATSEQLAAAGAKADAIASPSGAFVVAVDGAALRVIANGKEVAKAGAGGTVVLTQWSLGKHVERWRREAAAALKAK